MNFNITTPVHLLCGDDDLRPALQHVFFNQGYIVATNAHSLVAISMNDLGFSEEIAADLEGVLMHKDQFKQIVGSKKSLSIVKDDEHLFICVNGGALHPTIKNGLKDIKYPEWDKVINLNIENGESSVNEIGMNYKLINNIGRALSPLSSHSQLCFLFNEKSMAIHIKLNDENIKSMAVLMPVTI